MIACASSADKLAVCREHGADATIDYSREDLRERIKELTEGPRPDVVYDPVGGPYTRAGAPLDRLARAVPRRRLRSRRDSRGSR